jgi:acetoacetyl-CoA synthetase
MTRNSNVTKATLKCSRLVAPWRLDRITKHQGVVIYGRSDATLNRGGVRIGTSEIYRAVDKINEVRDSLIVCLEKTGGQFWMPLFVVLRDGESLTDSLKKKILTNSQ